MILDESPAEAASLLAEATCPWLMLTPVTVTLEPGRRRISNGHEETIGGKIVPKEDTASTAD